MRLFSPDFAYNYFLEKDKLYRSKGYDILKERWMFLHWLEVLKEPVLEIGTGWGYFTLCLAQGTVELISIDPDSDALDFARAFLEAWGKFKNVRFINAPAQRLPLPDSSVGTVVCFNMWHHLSDTEGILREIERVIVPGGIIAMADFSDEGFELVEQIHQDIYGKSHVVARRGFADLLESFAGAKVYEYKTKYEYGVCLVMQDEKTYHLPHSRVSFT